MGTLFHKVLIVDELQRLREDYKAELRKRAEEEKKRIEENECTSANSARTDTEYGDIRTCRSESQDETCVVGTCR